MSPSIRGSHPEGWARRPWRGACGLPGQWVTVEIGLTERGSDQNPGLDRLLDLVQFDALVVPPLDTPSLLERVAGDDIASVRPRMVGRLLLIAHEDESLTIDA
jgi:hypothetical protein